MPILTAADQTEIFYKDWGRGRPIVFIHGWPFDADMWEYQAVFLATQGFRVIAYDRRGFGRSGQAWDGYNYDTFADDLKVLMDSLDLQDVTLVGFSMGGGEVARYMSRHRGARVSRVAFISSVTPYLLQTDENPDGVDRGVFDKMIDALHADRPHFLANFAKLFFGAGLLNFAVTSEIQQWATMMALRGSPRATLACVRPFSETDFRADLGMIRTPALVIHGDSDSTVPVAKSGRLTARLIPGARYIEYAGAPHALFFTEKSRLNHDLLAFIETKTSTTSADRDLPTTS